MYTVFSGIKVSHHDTTWQDGFLSLFTLWCVCSLCSFSMFLAFYMVHLLVLTKYSLILSVYVIETWMQAPFKKTIKHTEKKSMKTMQVIHGIISMYYELASHEYTYIKCTNVRLLAWCFLFPSVWLLTRHEVSEMILVNKCHVSWTRFI